MSQYQNISFAPGKSRFVRVSPGVTEELAFEAKTTKVSILGGQVAMASGSILYTKPKPVTAVQGLPEVMMNESIRISFNVTSGDDGDITSLLDEAIRCLAVAREQYNMANGLVPTGNAVFATAP